MDNFYEREFPEVPDNVSDYCITYDTVNDVYWTITDDVYIDRSANRLRLINHSDTAYFYRYTSSYDSWEYTSGPFVNSDLNSVNWIYSTYDIQSYADSSRSGSSYVGFYSTTNNETVLGSISSGTVVNGLLSDLTTVIPFVVIAFVGYIGFLKAWNFFHDLLGGA